MQSPFDQERQNGWLNRLLQCTAAARPAVPAKAWNLSASEWELVADIIRQRRLRRPDRLSKRASGNMSGERSEFSAMDQAAGISH